MKNTQSTQVHISDSPDGFAPYSSMFRSPSHTEASTFFPLVKIFTTNNTIAVTLVQRF